MSSIATEESATVNGSLKYRLKHKWTVKDFASTYLTDSADKVTYPILYSEWFNSSIDSQVEFRISLRPRGRKERSQNSLSLYLVMKRSCPSLLTKSADVKYKFSLLNERNEEIHLRDSRRKFVYPSDIWGFFLKHRKLQDPVNGLLPGDQLTILVEVDVFPEPGIQHGNAPLLAKLKVASIENVRASLAGLLDSGAHSDVVLVVDGEELQAHKAILSAHSPVFSAMFKSKMTEDKSGKVIIPDLNQKVAQKLLRFIYKGEVEDLDEYAEELLVAADKYDVALLRDLCGQYLCGQVKPENAARLFAIADRHSVGQLKSTCVEYIRVHWENVMTRSDDWKPVHDLFIDELRLLKLQEDEETKEDEREDHTRKPLEESESAN